MKAYSEDLRERVIKQWQAGKSQAELVALFAVSAGSVKRWIRQYKQTGQVKAKQRTAWQRRLRTDQYEVLREQVGRLTDATLAEHVEVWENQHRVSVSLSTMWRALKAIGWSLKKRQWEPVSETKRNETPFASSSRP
jgi:transposase